MTQEELINVLKYIVKKCDMLINNGNYEADDYTQDTVEDIAELCNHILDGDYGKLANVKEVDLEKEIEKCLKKHSMLAVGKKDFTDIAKHFFELGLKAQQNINIDITNIDKVIEKNGVDPNSKEAKIFKESYYIALEKLKAKGE